MRKGSKSVSLSGRGSSATVVATLLRRDSVGFAGRCPDPMRADLQAGTGVRFSGFDGSVADGHKYCLGSSASKGRRRRAGTRSHIHTHIAQRQVCRIREQDEAHSSIKSSTSILWCPSRGPRDHTTEDAARQRHRWSPIIAPNSNSRHCGRKNKQAHWRRPGPEEGEQKRHAWASAGGDKGNRNSTLRAGGEESAKASFPLPGVLVGRQAADESSTTWRNIVS